MHRKQSSTTYPIQFLLVDANDHITPKTGLSPSVTLSKNGGAFAAASGAVSEIANGIYSLAANAADRNTLGELMLHAEVAGADNVDMKILIVKHDPFETLFDVAADVTTLEGRLSAARAGYLDALNTGVSLANDAITAAKIAADAITNAKIADDAITAAKIASDAITAAKIAADAIAAIQSGLALETTLGGIAADYARRTGDYAAAGDQMDLINAPNATAIAAIQAGLALEATLAGIAADYARRTGDYAAAGDQMDLINAPNATAITAIQAGLALEATLDAIMGAGWVNQTLVEIYASIVSGGISPAAIRDALGLATNNLDAQLSGLVTYFTNIMGPGWVDETLVAIKDLIDLVITHTGTDLPAYLVGLQSWLATEVIGFVQSGIIQQIRGSSWEIEIESLTLDPNLIQFAITKPLVRSAILDKVPPFNPAQPDAAAILLIDTDTGLLRLNGKQALDPALGGLAYVGTTLTITLAAEITAQLAPGVYNYGIQSINAGGIVSEPYMGRFTVLEDVVRATA